MCIKSLKKYQELLPTKKNKTFLVIKRFRLKLQIQIYKKIKLSCTPFKEMTEMVIFKLNRDTNTSV